MSEDSSPSEDWAHELRISWSAIYRPEWDARPEEYVTSGLVGWGRSRRLARIHDATSAFTAYLGIQHFDPARWNMLGAPVAKYFASLFLRGRTVSLHTYPTMNDALAAVRAFHERLCQGAV